VSPRLISSSSSRHTVTDIGETREVNRRRRSQSTTHGWSGEGSTMIGSPFRTTPHCPRSHESVGRITYCTEPHVGEF
jgi:hypothetical protein